MVIMPLVQATSTKASHIHSHVVPQPNPGVTSLRRLSDTPRPRPSARARSNTDYLSGRALAGVPLHGSTAPRPVPCRSSPHPSKHILSRSPKQPVPSHGVALCSPPPRRESLPRSLTTSYLPRPVTKSSPQKKVLSSQQLGVRDSPHRSIASGHVQSYNGGDISHRAWDASLPTSVQKYYDVKVRNESKRYTLAALPERDKRPSSRGIVHRQLLQPIGAADRRGLGCAPSTHVTKAEARRSAVSYGERATTALRSDQHSIDKPKTPVSILKSSLQNLPSIPSKVVSVPLFHSEKSQDFARTIQRAQTDAYWTGRLVALRDHYRNTFLDSQDLDNITQYYKKWDEEEVGRLIAIFRDLGELCATKEASQSLKDFKSHFALMNAIPSLLESNTVTPQAYGSNLPQAVKNYSRLGSEFARISTTSLAVSRLTLQRTPPPPQPDEAHHSSSSSAVTGVARKASWLVDKLMGRRTQSGTWAAPE